MAWLIALVVIIAIVIIVVVTTRDTSQKLSYTEFQTEVRTGNVKEASIANDTMVVVLRNRQEKVVFIRYEYALDFISEYNETLFNDAKNNYFQSEGVAPENATPEQIAAAETFAKETVQEQGVDLVLNNRYTTSFWDYLWQFLPIIFMVVIGFFLIRAMMKSQNGALSFGKTSAYKTHTSRVKFTDVAGADEEKEELKEIVEFLKAPGKFTSVGARIPKGVLMVGPPGTGKTLFAKAVAGEAGVPFFSISGSDFVEMFVGVGASRVRDLFEQAKKNMPCIIFIDEIDAVGRQRGAGLGGGHDEREQTLNQLLVHMDGFVANEGIIVMAATNRADVLDPALLRPGRFDRQIYVHKPDVKGREAIFKVHSRNKPLHKDVEFRTLARLTSGFSGADIENLLNEAAILCARENRTKVSMKDVFEGINKVVLGPQKKSRLVTEVDKRNTAYHESGHAIVARSLKDCDPVHEVSIIPRGHAAGYTMMRPDNDDNSYTINKLNAIIAMTMGGRAAEEIVIHDISAGAAGDIKSATGVARKMVTEWGMSSEIGPVYFGSSGEVFLGRDYGSHSGTSEDMTAKIDAEVRKLIETGHQKALDILNQKRSILDNMARVLVERETIYTDEVAMLMDGKSVEEVLAHIDAKQAQKDKEKAKQADQVEQTNSTTTQETANSTPINDSKSEDSKTDISNDSQADIANIDTVEIVIDKKEDSKDKKENNKDKKEDSSKEQTQKPDTQKDE